MNSMTGRCFNTLWKAGPIKKRKSRQTPSRIEISWTPCHHPLPEHVYDVYMHYWADVRLACEDARTEQRFV